MTIFGLTLILTAAGVILGGLVVSRRTQRASGAGDPSSYSAAVAGRPETRYEKSRRSSRFSGQRSSRSGSRSSSQRSSLEIAAEAAAEELLSGSSASPRA